MAKGGSSQRWLREHETDPYVRMARERGYRSRASFKLIALDDKEHLLRPGATVVDLGAAPGGWSQIATQRVGPKGRIVACDCLPLDPLPGVEFLQGDLNDPALVAALLALIGAGGAQVVLSDLAPAMSGIKTVDQARSFLLCECALDVAEAVLAPGGAFVVKVFQGEGFESFLRLLRARFAKVAMRKPEASRGRSAEIYAVARGYRPGYAILE